MAVIYISNSIRYVFKVQYAVRSNYRRHARKALGHLENVHNDCLAGSTTTIS